MPFSRNLRNLIIAKCFKWASSRKFNSRENYYNILKIFSQNVVLAEINYLKSIIQFGNKVSINQNYLKKKRDLTINQK